MPAVRRLWGQISLQAALSMAAALLAVGAAVWSAASHTGAQEQRLVALESRMERVENALGQVLERLPPRPKR